MRGTFGDIVGNLLTIAAGDELPNVFIHEILKKCEIYREKRKSVSLEDILRKIFNTMSATRIDSFIEHIMQKFPRENRAALVDTVKNEITAELKSHIDGNIDNNNYYLEDTVTTYEEKKLACYSKKPMAIYTKQVIL